MLLCGYSGIGRTGCYCIILSHTLHIFRRTVCVFMTVTGMVNVHQPGYT